jgi:hypothetical protein
MQKPPDVALPEHDSNARTGVGGVFLMPIPTDGYMSYSYLSAINMYGTVSVLQVSGVKSLL